MQKHSWDPLFLSSAGVDVNIGDLKRELEVSFAAGECNLCSLLLKAAREKADARLLKHLADFDQQGALGLVVKRMPIWPNDVGWK